MHQWSYIFIIFTLLVSACRHQPDKPSADLPANDQSQATLLKDPSAEASVQDKPSTTKKSFAEGGIVLPEVDPLEVEGNIVVAGSSTVFPLSKAMYDRFIEEGYSGTIKLDSVGSGAGFKLFCQEGESDISNASRAIKEQEVKACSAIGRKPIEFRVGTDALAVVIHPANTFLTNVTLKELAAIFTAEKWSDVNPSWPNELIQRFIPDAESGTLDFFVEHIFQGNAEPLLNTPHTVFSSDDDDLVQGVSTNPYAIGFFGYAYYQQNAKTLKILSIEGIEPNFDTTEEGKYPLARPLFIYSDANLIQKKPQVGAFINFYLTHINEEIEQVGYFPASRKTLDVAKINLLKALGYKEFLTQQGAKK